MFDWYPFDVYQTATFLAGAVFGSVSTVLTAYLAIWLTFRDPRNINKPQ